MDPGIYTLILSVDKEREVHVGSLGRICFMKGYYAYTGSARGPGGLVRVERHLKVLSGISTARRWHIDYLLPNASFVGVAVTYTSDDLECAAARMIGSELKSIPGFGCTDCRCTSHLHFSENLEKMHEIVERAHSSIDQGNCRS